MTITMQQSNRYLRAYTDLILAEMHHAEVEADLLEEGVTEEEIAGAQHFINEARGVSGESAP